MATTATARRHISLRVTEEELARIDGFAEEHGLNRTDYIVRTCTGELEDPSRFEQRLAGHEIRLIQLERANGIAPSRPTGI